MDMKVRCCCCYCEHEEVDKVVLEINFRDCVIYWYCPACKKMNKIETIPPAQPLPKIKGMRR